MEDPSLQEILAAIPKDLSRFKEAVFCGYGEATYRLGIMHDLSVHLKRNGIKKIRLNTTGLGNLIHGRNIVPALADFIDSVSISLNTTDPEKYLKMMHPKTEYKKTALEAVLEFIKLCVPKMKETVVTAVDMPDNDVETVKKLSLSFGAKFRLRPYLDDYESE